MNMKRTVLLFFALAFGASRQQDSNETLNETLDKLIQQAQLVEDQESNDSNPDTSNNDSRILFFNSPEVDSSEKSEKRGTYSRAKSNFDENNLQNIMDVLRELVLHSKLANNSHEQAQNIVSKEVTVTVEHSTPPKIANTNFNKVNDLDDNAWSKSGQPLNIAKNPDEKITSLSGKYPEIIIDKITYHNNDNKANSVKTQIVTEKQQINQDSGDNNYPLETDDMESLLNDLLTKTSATTNSMKTAETQTNHYTNDEPNTYVSQYGAQQPCGNIFSYSAPCQGQLYNKLADYQHLRDAHRIGDQYLNTAMQLTRWNAQNARQDALIHNIRRYHFVPEIMNNMKSTFSYRRLLGLV